MTLNLFSLIRDEIAHSRLQSKALTVAAPKKQTKFPTKLRFDSSTLGEGGVSVMGPVDANQKDERDTVDCGFHPAPG